MINYVFIDMDNTIAENQTCEDIEYREGLYLNKRPINIVIDGILNLYKDCHYIILSKTDGGHRGMLEKRAWLHKYFPYTDTILLISQTDNKNEFIAHYLSNHDIRANEVLLIDDKKVILQDCARLGIAVKYPQQIICDYEEMIRSEK